MALASFALTSALPVYNWPALTFAAPSLDLAPAENKKRVLKATPLPLDALPEARPQAVPDDDYSDFASYTYSQLVAGPGQYRSAIMAPESLSIIPVPTDCTGKRPAVAIDLDVGDRTFDVNDPPLPLGGLPAILERLRRSGVTVLWITQAPPSARKKLKVILAATGLDMDGVDEVMTTPGNERKQNTRLAAARSWCILAVAGDQMSDFEEAYDFLRDANGPVGSVLRMNIGNGWFIKQPPIQ